MKSLLGVVYGHSKATEGSQFPGYVYLWREHEMNYYFAKIDQLVLAGSIDPKLKSRDVIDFSEAEPNAYAKKYRLHNLTDLLQKDQPGLEQGEVGER